MEWHYKAPRELPMTKLRSTGKEEILEEAYVSDKVGSIEASTVMYVTKDAYDKLLAENAELKSEVERLNDALGGLLCHATGSLLSYSTYPKQTMYDAVDDYIEQRIEQALERMK